LDGALWAGSTSTAPVLGAHGGKPTPSTGDHSRGGSEMDAIIEVLAVVLVFGGLFAAFHKHFVEG